MQDSLQRVFRSTLDPCNIWCTFAGICAKEGKSNRERKIWCDRYNQYDSRFLIVEPVALYDPVYPSLSGVDNAVEIVERSRYNAGANSRSELNRKRPRHGAVLQTSGVSTIDQQCRRHFRRTIFASLLPAVQVLCLSSPLVRGVPFPISRQP